MRFHKKDMEKTPTFTAYLAPIIDKGMYHYPQMDIPQEIADALLGGSNMLRVIVYFENGMKIHRALKRNKNGETFISLGKSTLKDAKVEPGTELPLILEVDQTEFGFELPEEFAEVMNQDPEGEKAFMQLKHGMKRNFLHYIVSAKTVDTRINRSLRIMENLKQGIISAQKPR